VGPGDFCTGISQFYCGTEECTVALVPGRNQDDPNDWLFSFNTGQDDPVIPIEVENVGVPEDGTAARARLRHGSAYNVRHPRYPGRGDLAS
jgi:hypothetical protein